MLHNLQIFSSNLCSIIKKYQFKDFSDFISPIIDFIANHSSTFALQIIQSSLLHHYPKISTLIRMSKNFNSKEFNLNYYFQNFLE